MIRNYKAFGLALVAMLALGAFVAQAASAKPLTVEGVATGTTIHITADQETAHKFTTPNGSVSCTTASFDATKATETAAGAISELTVAPTYTGCTAFGFASAHVAVNGCTYTLTTPTSIGVGVVTWHPSQIHIDCPTKPIEITPTSFGVSVCTQSVGAQTPTSGHIVGRNVEKSNPMDVTLEVTLSGLHYTGSGSVCGNSETHSDATYSGNSTGKCYKNAAHTEQVGCTFS